MTSQKNKRKKTEETVRNIILVALAVGMVVIFFNLDFMNKGESVFSRQATVKLRFQGDLNKQAFTDDEVDKMLDFISKYKKILESATLETRLQDTYMKVTDRSPVIFEVHLILKDGTNISTPARRARRKVLIPAILEKLNKDITAYMELKRDGVDMKSLINTN